MAVAAIARQKTVADADDQRWQLVLAHAPNTNFFYAVISTKIFCRTTCPSRRPRRANVTFFNKVADAKAAGFRPCKRCKPEALDEPNPDNTAKETVESACNFIKNVNGDTKLSEIASHVGLSPRYFHGLFKQVTGVTPGVFSARVRQQNKSGSEPPLSEPALSDTFSPASEQLFTPVAQSPLIDDFMLSFYGSADAYAELDDVDINNPATWDYSIAFEPDPMYGLDPVALPISMSTKTSAEADLQQLIPPLDTFTVPDLDGFTPYTPPATTS